MIRCWNIIISPNWILKISNLPIFIVMKLFKIFLRTKNTMTYNNMTYNNNNNNNNNNNFIIIIIIINNNIIILSVPWATGRPRGRMCRYPLNLLHQCCRTGQAVNFQGNIGSLIRLYTWPVYKGSTVASTFTSQPLHIFS